MSTKFLNSSYELVHFFMSLWLHIENFMKNWLHSSFLTGIFCTPEQLFLKHLFLQKHLSTVASLSTTFLLHTLDKKYLLYKNAFSNDSCRICFILALPKFQFIPTMFIAISGWSNTSVDLRSNLRAIFCHKALSFRWVVDQLIKSASQDNISLILMFHFTVTKQRLINYQPTFLPLKYFVDPLVWVIKFIYVCFYL